MKYLLLLAILAASCDAACFTKHKRTDEKCAFTIKCTENLTKFDLPDDCKASTNYDVTADVTLVDILDNDEPLLPNANFEIITTLKVVGKYYSVPLRMLEHTGNLRELYMHNIEIATLGENQFDLLKNLEILDLSQNLLSNITGQFHFEEVNKLKRLNLAYNMIKDIESYTFEELTALIELDLSNNLIEDLSGQPFQNLTSLVILKLSFNNIKYIDASLNNLKNLRHLYLRGNMLTSEDLELILIMDQLKTFDISNNSIETVTPNLFVRHCHHFNGTTMYKILMSENKITVVPNATLDNITSSEVKVELTLSRNQIKTVEYEAFNDTKKMISLDLSSNKLTSFVVNPLHLVYLRNLNLSFNDISGFNTDTFFMITDLNILDMSHNSLSYIYGSSIWYGCELRNMTLMTRHSKSYIPRQGGIVDFSYNYISNITLQYYPHFQIRKLLLNFNQITDLKLVDLSAHVHLHHLEVSHNYIAFLNTDSLQVPSTLFYLDLSHNQIETIAPSTFFHMNHLVTLILSHNRFMEPSYGTFQGLVSLKYLYLSNNSIAKFTSQYTMELKLLTVLDLSYNDLEKVDYDNWLTHVYLIKVSLDGNVLCCDWLAKTLRDFYRGYSMMKPSVRSYSIGNPSIDGIPCKEMVEISINCPPINNQCTASSRLMVVDERLLVINKKILDAVLEQTQLLKENLKYIVKNRNYL